MKSNEVSLIEILSQHNTSFYIPNYQRNYVWSNADCMRLINDIQRVMHGEHSQHFFGFIVLKEENDKKYSERRFQVVDGQQRLTTFFLLFAALKSYATKHSNTFTNKELGIIDYYREHIIQCDTTKKVKLKAVSNDDLYFKTVINDSASEFDKKLNRHNIGINYFAIYKALERKFKTNDFSIESFNNILSRLKIILLLLDDSDDAQMIFDTMNSTGRALSPGDSIRNLLLMDAHTEEKSNELYKLWEKIESNVCVDEMTTSKASKGDQVTRFVWVWLKMKLNSVKILINNTYGSLINYVESSTNGTKSCQEHFKEQLLKELAIYSDYYNFIITGHPNSSMRTNYSNPEEELDIIGRSLACTNILKLTAHYPYLLEVINALYTHMLTPNDVINILLILESYFIRRILRNLPSNCYNGIFVGLHSKLVELKTKYCNYSYVELLSNTLTSLTERTGFPFDSDFEEDLKNIQFDCRTNSIKYTRLKYLLSKLESAQTASNYSIIDKYSLERLLINPEVTIRQIHDFKYCKKNKLVDLEAANESMFTTLGNIRLTNTRDPTIDYNQPIIMKRLNMLIQQSLKIWPYPKHQLTITSHPDYLTLQNEPLEFKSMKFKNITFDGNLIIPGWNSTYDTYNMTECLEVIYKRLHKRFNLYRILNDDKQQFTFIDKHPFSSTKENKTARSIELDGIYIYIALGNEQNIENLVKVFDYFKDDISYDDVKFYISKY